MKISISGASGFVGRNIILNFGGIQDFSFILEKDLEIKITENIVIHLAGKAHDLKNEQSSNEYYEVNTELTKKIYDAFLESKAKVFITLSSVKAVADQFEGILYENTKPNPKTHYGKSKLLAEKYIFSKPIPSGKRVYVLRPCMIHGPSNKGNLNILYNFVSKFLIWPLGMFENSRSYLSVDNLCFIIKELIDREDIPSGVYNVADDVPLSTNEVVKLVGESNNKKIFILNFSKNIFKGLAFLGDFFKLPFNSNSLQKLTESYVVSNAKIKLVLGKNLPVSSKEGLKKTFHSFVKNA
jgi:nucleoside-diphosphate-sugar epimerase